MKPATAPTPTLLVISQVYPPDPAAVGQHCADVAEEMVRRGWRVKVFTANRGYDDPRVRYGTSEHRAGVEIRRFAFSSFGKRSIAVRLFAQLFFVIQSALAAAWVSDATAILASTSPPFAGFFGALIARLRRVPLVWWVMDLNPDQMIAAGRIGPRSLPARVFNAMNRRTLNEARAVIVLDRYMRDRVLAKTYVPEKLHVIPPWAPTEQGGTDPAGANAFRLAHQLTGKFVVMYSGNHAVTHPLTTLLDAAKILEDEHRIKFVFIGGGAGKADVEERIRAGSPNIVALPYQSFDSLAASLSAADLHVVSMGNHMVGVVHPCKIYGALAVGRPILFFGPEASHAGDILRRWNVGFRIDHGDALNAAATIREQAAVHRATLTQMGATAAAVAVREFPRSRLVEAVCDICASAVPGERLELSQTLNAPHTEEAR
jgi:colanic acid biosynthesis glycosyl transferase WcaI